MKAVRLYQAAVIVGFVLLVEVLSLTGSMHKVTMQPSHVIQRVFVLMTVRGQYAADIGTTMLNVFIAFVSAFLIGILTGTILHGYKTARDVLDPLFATYYAIPLFAFYPLFVVMFGLGEYRKFVV